MVVVASHSAPRATAPKGGRRITTEDVAHVARLSRLALTDEELERFTDQLAAVLDHAEDVAALDTAGVEPTAHPLPLRNVLRDDVPCDSLPRDVVLAAAPEAEDGRFRVPRILGEAP
jgi:aspartyl-tRNA(Asn)/glutamyl-tRNA(Gln) amidotransferase subunit C